MISEHVELENMYDSFGALYMYEMQKNNHSTLCERLQEYIYIYFISKRLKVHVHYMETTSNVSGLYSLYNGGQCSVSIYLLSTYIIVISP